MFSIYSTSCCRESQQRKASVTDRRSYCLSKQCWWPQIVSGNEIDRNLLINELAFSLKLYVPRERRPHGFFSPKYIFRNVLFFFRNSLIRYSAVALCETQKSCSSSLNLHKQDALFDRGGREKKGKQRAERERTKTLIYKRKIHTTNVRAQNIVKALYCVTSFLNELRVCTRSMPDCFFLNIEFFLWIRTTIHSVFVFIKLKPTWRFFFPFSKFSSNFHSNFSL